MGCHHPRLRTPPELGLRHGPPVLRHVLLLHESGAGSAGSLEEHEGEQGLQEPGVPAAQESRREGGTAADGCDQLVDDGGDATLLIHKGKEFEESAPSSAVTATSARA